jgi:hypothetical protein
MALVNYFSSPAHIGRAASLLRTLQEVIEEAVDGQGKSLNEGQYLRLCELTSGIHKELHASQARFTSGHRRSRPADAADDDDDDLFTDDRIIRRARRVPCGTILVTRGMRGRSGLLR